MSDQPDTVVQLVKNELYADINLLFSTRHQREGTMSALIAGVRAELSLIGRSMEKIDWLEAAQLLPQAAVLGE